MVLVLLKGGLGNQLFQYAMGRGLASRKATALKLDAVSGFEHDPYGRVYALGHFNTLSSFASAEEVARLTGGRVNRILNRFRPRFRRSVVHERVTEEFTYVRDLLRSRRTVYLDGYWQNERYFADIADVIRREFTVHGAPDSVNQGSARQIGDTNSISIHVRRLHGVSSDGRRRFEAAMSSHGACGLDYYQRAIDKVAATVANPHFFVFSDDHEWAQANLHYDAPTVHMTHNGPDKDYEDLRLMRLCKHHIIANSTFSWWGAWLASHPRKIVIAPQRWFADDSRDTRQLMPATWIRM